MSCWGFSEKLDCLFCYGCIECNEHILFSYSFSRRIWRAAMNAYCFIDPPFYWDDVVEWGTSKLHGKSLQACLGHLCLESAVYHLWKYRNDL